MTVICEALPGCRPPSARCRPGAEHEPLALGAEMDEEAQESRSSGLFWQLLGHPGVGTGRIGGVGVPYLQQMLPQHDHAGRTDSVGGAAPARSSEASCSERCRQG